MQHKILRKSKTTCRLVLSKSVLSTLLFLWCTAASMTGLSLLKQHSLLTLVPYSETTLGLFQHAVGCKYVKRS